jgi:malate dehydrogenase
MRAKVTIVGAGMTGATMAQRLAETGYADVVLQDIIEGMPQGKALDLAESAPHVGFNAQLTGSNDWANTKGSDVVVITSGMPRKPGMTREELLNINAGIVTDVARKAAKWSPRSTFIIFANPMDVMCHVAIKASRFPAHRVIGQGGMLDSARYRTFIAWETKSSVEDVHAQVLGGHTEATMVPIVSTAHVGGVPLTKLLSKKRIEGVVQRTKNGGAEIVGLLKTGSAFYAPAAATAEMVEAILLDQKRIVPCATMTTGQYGIKGSYVGLPVKLGRRGVEAIYAPPLWENEIEGIRTAAASTKDLVGLIKKPTRKKKATRRKPAAKKASTAKKRTARKK